jgi:hypothetical protein
MAAPRSDRKRRSASRVDRSRSGKKPRSSDAWLALVLEEVRTGHERVRERIWETQAFMLTRCQEIEDHIGGRLDRLAAVVREAGSRR